MSNSKISEVLKQLANGEISVERAAGELSLTAPVNDLEFATVDHQRSERIGFPEVVYGLSKTPKDTADIAEPWRNLGRRSTSDLGRPARKKRSNPGHCGSCGRNFRLANCQRGSSYSNAYGLRCQPDNRRRRCGPA